MKAEIDHWLETLFADGDQLLSYWEAGWREHRDDIRFAVMAIGRCGKDAPAWALSACQEFYEFRDARPGEVSRRKQAAWRLASR